MRSFFGILFICIITLSSCSKCNDDIPFEGFDIAIVDDLKNSLIGEKGRYQIEDFKIEVSGSNIVYGHYIKNDITYFLVDYSMLDNSNVSTSIELSQNYSIPLEFVITKDFDSCYPHNDLTGLSIDGELYDLQEQILVFQ